MLKFLLFLTLILTGILIAQPVHNLTEKESVMDTSDFFPLQLGDYWEYRADNYYGSEYISLKVIEDTLMNNGLTYKYIQETSNFSPSFEYYFRKDSGNVFQYYGDSVACISRDYKYFDFFFSDSSIWKVCRDLGPCGNARGIANTYYDYTYYSFFHKPLETKRFEDVLLDSTDTLWIPCESRIYWLSKALGIMRILYYNVGDFWLQGAIIDGSTYGTLVGIDDNKVKHPTEYYLSQNYPNPFNISSVIKYSIPKTTLVTLKILNTLGEEIETLINEEKHVGTYELKWNAAGLPSGVYFYRIQAENFIQTKKMILLK